MPTMNDLIDEYVETRLAYDDAHEISSAANKEHKQAKAQLVEKMIEDKQKGVKLDYGIAFSLRNQFSISCNKDNEEDVKDWLHGHYGDIEEFTVMKVDKKTVEERLKADIEGEQLDEFDVPDFMKLKTRPDVSCTGWKKYSTERRT